MRLGASRQPRRRGGVRFPGRLHVTDTTRGGRSEAMIEYRPKSRAECGRVLDMLCKLNVAWESDLKGEITIQDGPERVHMWAPATLAALAEAKRGLTDILDNHPDVWPSMGIKANQTPERKIWRDKIKGFNDAARTAIAAATGA